MISKKIRIKGEKLNNKDLVLDIETTGLDFKIDKLVLLGLVKKENNKSYVFQYFAENDNEEIRLLKIFLRELKGKRLITFNGDTFDIPFLNSRLIAHQLMPVFIEESLDIYKIIKKNSKFFSYESMKLVDIEKLIGINRDDPSRYKVISKLTDDIITRARPLPILKHNENDLIATEALSDIENLYINKLSIESKIGKFWLIRANINKDIGNFEYQSENILNDLFVAENNYQISIKEKTITLNLHVLYGKFNEVDNGFVCINNFDIKNESEIDINDGLLIIRENSTYNFKNLLNLCKKIIENHYWFSIFQFISFMPFDFKKSFALENGLDPKNPRLADSGDGWTDSIIKWLWFVIRLFLLLAKLPQRINTTGFSLLFNRDIILSVNICQPILLWELGFFSSTVRLAFNNKTPCLAQVIKEPLEGYLIPRSVSSSLYMFFKEGGNFTPSFTEKDKPWAWP